MVPAAMKLKYAYFLEDKLDSNLDSNQDQPRQHIEKQRHYFASKGLASQGCGFSSSHI